MQKLNLKNTFSFFKRGTAAVRIAAGPDLAWQIILLCFVTCALVGVVYAALLFASTSDLETREVAASANSTVSIFNRNELHQLILNYTAKANNLPALKKTVAAPADPSR